MTDNGDPYENAMAERVNGILKAGFRLNRVFKSLAEALLATNSAISNYNLLRPHMSCDYMTPAKAHSLDQPMREHWKKKKESGIANNGIEMWKTGPQPTAQSLPHSNTGANNEL